MKRKNNDYNCKKLVSVLAIIICMIVSLTAVENWISVKAEESINMSGDKYKFSDDDEYPISQKGYNGSTDGNSFGIFSLSGDYEGIGEKDGFKAFDVKQGNLRLSYNFDSYKLSLPDESWNIYDDGCDEVDGFELEDDINNGSIIVLSSINGVKWAIDKELSNVFVNNSVLNNGSFYETKTVQLINGCYYKVIIAYEMRIKSGSIGIGSFSKNTYDYVRYAEVYRFYAVNSEENANATSPDQIPRLEIGDKIKTVKDNGYAGNEAIDAKDPHLGWSIGTFVVNGYTRETKDNISGNSVFLKNVGDKVTLWFNLKQDIDKINGNANLTVDVDKDGYDQYFEVQKTNFKRGTLIIRFTDHEGKKTDPIIYTNYLAACASTGAYTKVELFEEGDYEVALNYSIKDSSGWISSSNDYRIFFKFSIRNGNCMVFPFDTDKGAELADNAITSNGFRLDMARSRYLSIDVQRSILKKNGDIYSEDVRFNRPAKDGEVYNEEGIYRFTVRNNYTNESVVKTIYVGDSPIYYALSRNKFSLAEINDKLKEGAEISTDGVISFPIVDEVDDIVTPDISKTETETLNKTNTNDLDKKNKEDTTNNTIKEESDNLNKKTNSTKEDNKSDGEESGSSVGIIVLIVVLLCGIGAGAYIYFTKIKTKGNGTVNIVAPQQVVEKIKEAENADTLANSNSENITLNKANGEEKQ